MAQAKTKFFIIRKDTLEAYELSATTEVSIRTSRIATSKRVETGKALTDNTYLDNTMVQFSGIITNIKNKSNIENTEKFLNDINTFQALDTPVLVEVYADGQFVDNCIITDFEYSKTSTEGNGAWKVNLSFKQIAFSERARLVVVAEPESSVAADTASQANQSNNTVQSVDEEVYETFGAQLSGGDFLTIYKTDTTTTTGGQ